MILNDMQPLMLHALGRLLKSSAKSAYGMLTYFPHSDITAK